MRVTAAVHCVLEVGEQKEGVPRKHGGWEGAYNVHASAHTHTHTHTHTNTHIHSLPEDSRALPWIPSKPVGGISPQLPQTQRRD